LKGNIMTGQNILYFVGARSCDNESQDLLVVAANTVAAEGLWRQHFDLDAQDKPEFVRPVPGVTPTREPGAIGWDEINPE
jgi:hypothetical protein